MAIDLAPGIDAIREAAHRLAGHAVVTPLLSSPVLDERYGGRLLVKAEPLQRTGSFKFRGAYNAIAQIPAKNRAGGVVAFSSGNHAQGVAAAARLLGVPAVIVMPNDAPAIKIANTKGHGAEVVLYDRWGEDREAIAKALAAERGASLIKPFDQPEIIAGQGTIGLELVAQAGDIGESLDAVIVCCSGGGLVAGIATALAAESPSTEVYAAEPAAFDDMRRSLEAGQRVRNAADSKSFCDALLSPTPGELTFSIAKRLLAGGVVATDPEVEEAMAIAFEELKLVVEPGGAVALAAVTSGRFALEGRTVAVIASGGNVDRDIFSAALETRR